MCNNMETSKHLIYECKNMLLILEILTIFFLNQQTPLAYSPHMYLCQRERQKEREREGEREGGRGVLLSLHHCTFYMHLPAADCTFTGGKYRAFITWTGHCVYMSAQEYALKCITDQVDLITFSIIILAGDQLETCTRFARSNLTASFDRQEILL